VKLGQNYKIVMSKKLGAGAFGEIYYGQNLKTKEEVAVKMESTKAKSLQLSVEYKILSQLQGEGIPKAHFLSVVGEYNAMVMDLLGPSLEDLFANCKRKFDLKTVLLIAI